MSIEFTQVIEMGKIVVVLKKNLKKREKYPPEGLILAFFWLNHKFCGISDSSRSSVGSYRIASERNIRHQDIRIPVCEES